VVAWIAREDRADGHPQVNQIWVPETHSVLDDERVRRRLGDQIFSTSEPASTYHFVVRSGTRLTLCSYRQSQGRRRAQSRSTRDPELRRVQATHPDRGTGTGGPTHEWSRRSRRQRVRSWPVDSIGCSAHISGIDLLRLFLSTRSDPAHAPVVIFGLPVRVDISCIGPLHAPHGTQSTLRGTVPITNPLDPFFIRCGLISRN
jgi:hypothetical protein